MDKKEFVLKKSATIIKRLADTNVMSIADILLQHELINDGTYDKIRKVTLKEEKARELLTALTSLKSYSVFYDALRDIDKHLFEELEAESKQCSETDSCPLAKRPRIEKPRVKEPDKENRNETYFGTNGNFAFYTLSKLHEHVEDPANAECMVTSLERRLEGQMKQVESWLQERVPKPTVVFDHKRFREVYVNRDLIKFLEYKPEAKFPKKVVIDQFFGKRNRTKPSESESAQDEPGKSNNNIRTTQESFSPQEEIFYPISIDHAKNSGALIPNCPGVQDMTEMGTELLLPSVESTACHPEINSGREADSTSVHPSLTGSWDSGYDGSNQKSSQDIYDPPQEAQRDFGTSIGTLTSLSKCQQSDPDEAVGADGATTWAATPASVAQAATPGTVASAASSVEASSSGPLDANGGSPINGKPKKRQNRQVHNKAKQQRDILLQFLMKQIPSEKLGTDQEAEEVNKIKACVTNVSLREHPRYPLLMAYNCKVFRDPRTNQKILIEIVDSTNFEKEDQLNLQSDFKVQFHMWLLGLPEAVVLWETGEKVIKVKVIKVKSFEDEEKRFQRYLHDAVVPVLALYKKLENEEFFKLN